jgi:hypothetical protein
VSETKDSPNDNLTILSLATDFFGCSPDYELYSAVQDASIVKLRDFYDQYRDFTKNSRLKAPPLEKGTLRPFLQTDRTGVTARWLWGAFNMDPAAFAEENAPWGVVDALKHRLLYCHSVAVEDPLGIVLRLALNDFLHPIDIERNKQRLLNLINLLIHMRPLIEQHVLCFVSPEYYLENDLPPSPFETLFRKLCEDRSQLPEPNVGEFYQRAPQPTRELWDRKSNDGAFRTLRRNVLIKAATDRICNSLAMLSYVGNRVSLYLPFRYDIQLLSEFNRRISSAELQLDRRVFRMLPDRENRLFAQLMEFDLPGLKSLSPEDILAMRGGDAFEQWRTLLKVGLQRASELPPDLVDLESAQRSVLAESVQPAYAKLKSEFENSGFLRKVRSASTPMICGAVGGVVGYLIDAGLGGLVGALTGGFLEAGVELVRKLSERDREFPDQRSALNHFVALLE